MSPKRIQPRGRNQQKARKQGCAISDGRSRMRRPSRVVRVAAAVAVAAGARAPGPAAASSPLLSAPFRSVACQAQRRAPRRGPHRCPWPEACSHRTHPDTCPAQVACPDPGVAPVAIAALHHSHSSHSRGGQIIVFAAIRLPPVSLAHSTRNTRRGRARGTRLRWCSAA